MIIEFRECWRIRAGDEQWVLEKSRVAEKGKNAGEVQWTAKGYFSDPRRAVVASWKMQTLEKDEIPSDDLAAVLNRLDDLYNSFDETIAEVRKNT